MKRITRIVVSMGALALVACASQGATTSAAAGVTPQASKGDAVNHQNGVPSAYVHKVIDGQDVFCRDDTDTGSRVKHRQVCLTREQLEEQQRNHETSIQDFERRESAH